MIEFFFASLTKPNTLVICENVKVNMNNDIKNEVKVEFFLTILGI